MNPFSNFDAKAAAAVSDYKSHHKGKGDFANQAARRARALDAQHARRRDAANRLRGLVAHLDEDDGDDAIPLQPVTQQQQQQPQNPRHRRHPKRHARRQVLPYRWRGGGELMLPEEMAAPPVDLHTAWLVSPLPMGDRCFVVAARGRTGLYRVDGTQLVPPFQSRLPGGSAGGGHAERITLLDGVFDWNLRRVYLLDLMVYDGNDMWGCDTAMRLNFLSWKLAELPGGGAALGKYGVEFQRVPFFEATSEGLRAAYECAAGAGIALAAFVMWHHELHYEPGGVSPGFLYCATVNLPTLSAALSGGAWCPVEARTHDAATGTPTALGLACGTAVWRRPRDGQN